MSLTLRQSYPSLRRLARAAFGHSSFLLQFFFLVLSLFVGGSSLELSSTLQTGGDPCPCHRDWRAAGRGEPMTWCNLTLMYGGGGREWLHSSDDLCKTRSHLPSHLPSCRNHAVASLNPSRRCQTRACWDLLHVSVMLDYLTVLIIVGGGRSIPRRS